MSKSPYLHRPDPDRPLQYNAPTCAMCGKKVFEVLPLGPNHESICEDCSEKDAKTTATRIREQGMSRG